MRNLTMPSLRSLCGRSAWTSGSPSAHSGVSGKLSCGVDPPHKSPDRSRAQSDSLADRHHAEALPPEFKILGADSGIRLFDLPPSPRLALRSYPVDAGLHSVLNHRPLKLGKHSAHLKEGLACWHKSRLAWF